MALEAWNRPDDPLGANGIKVDFWVNGKQAKAIFQHLRDDRVELEKAFGEPLHWDELPERQGSRISVLNPHFDVTDKGTWTSQWMFTRLAKLRNLFSARVNLIADQT
jgi:hypothetical protein